MTTKLDVLAAEIAALKDSDGRVTPEAVLKAAESESSPLHAYFEWDNDVAAHEHRLNQARDLIRQVRFTITYEDRSYKVPRYVSDPRVEKSAYIDTTDPATKKKSVSRKILHDELDRIGNAIERGAKLAVVFGLEEEFRTLAVEVAKIRSTLGKSD